MKLEKLIQEIKTDMECEVGGSGFTIDRRGKRLFQYCPYFDMESVQSLDCMWLSDTYIDHEGGRFYQCNNVNNSKPKIIVTRSEYNKMLLL